MRVNPYCWTQRAKDLRERVPCITVIEMLIAVGVAAQSRAMRANENEPCGARDLGQHSTVAGVQEIRPEFSCAHKDCIDWRIQIPGLRPKVWSKGCR